MSSFFVKLCLNEGPVELEQRRQAQAVLQPRVLVVGHGSDFPLVCRRQPACAADFCMPHVGEEAPRDCLELTLHVQHDLGRAVKFVLVHLVVSGKHAVDLGDGNRADKCDPVGVEETPRGLFEAAGLRRVGAQHMGFVVVRHLGLSWTN